MKTFLAFSMCFFLSLVLTAEPIKITGNVLDVQHSPLHGATVVLYDAESEELLGEIETDNFGNFQFDDVSAGTYEIRLFHDGFEIEKEKNILLTENRTSKHIDFYMSPSTEGSTATMDQTPIE